MDKLIHLILLSGLVSLAGSFEENLALEGTATQSSTHYDWAAQNAIDGVRYGDASSFCSSTSSESDSWWRLDLLDIFDIKSVIISARSAGYLAEANGAEIRVGNSLENNGNNNPRCAVTPDPLPGNTVSFSCHGMEGRYVNVVMTGRTSRLTLCEVEVYQTENLALKGTVTQSSTHVSWVAQHAIDGKRYGETSSVCSATVRNSDSWWRLDLLDIYNISTVIITARSDCCVDQTNGAEIRVGNSLVNNGNNNPRCAVTSGFLTGYTITYSCHGMEGRYVNVLIPVRISHLTLCELEVYGTENLAVKGTVTQSSTRSTWFSQNAIDGVRHGPDTGLYCSATTNESDPWWRLDLLDIFDIKSVIITARSDGYLNQTSGAEIRIGNSLENNGNNNPICAVTSGLLAGQTISYSCHGMEGRYVNVVMSGRTSRLTLCEVEVYGADHRKSFLRLKFSSSGDVAAESDEILHQLQSALGSHISDFKLSWTQLPKKEEEEEEEQ